MFKTLMVYVFALVSLYFAFTVSGMKMINYIDPIAVIYLAVIMMLGSSCFNRKQWKNLFASVRGQTQDILLLQNSQKMLERLWVFILAGVGINLLVEFVPLLGYLHNKATLGSVLALWILNFIYVLLLRLLVFQPLSMRLQRGFLGFD